MFCVFVDNVNCYFWPWFKFDRYFRSYRSERRSKMKNYRILSMSSANAFIWYATWLYYWDDPIWSLWPPYLTVISGHTGQSVGQKWKIIAYYQCPLQMLSFDIQHGYIIEMTQFDLSDRPIWPLFPVIAVKAAVKNEKLSNIINVLCKCYHLICNMTI